MKIEKRNKAINVNLAALAAAAGSGNKDAVKKVNEIIGEIKDEDRHEENKERLKKGVPIVEAPLLTAEQLANLDMGEKQHGQQRYKNP